MIATVVAAGVPSGVAVTQLLSLCSCNFCCIANLFESRQRSPTGKPLVQVFRITIASTSKSNIYKQRKVLTSTYNIHTGKIKPCKPLPDKPEY